MSVHCRTHWCGLELFNEGGRNLKLVIICSFCMFFRVSMFFFLSFFSFESSFFVANTVASLVDFFQRLKLVVSRCGICVPALTLVCEYGVVFVARLHSALL